MRARTGFTLIEAAVSLTIVSITAIAALAAGAAEVRSADRAQRQLAALALAQDRLAAVELLAPAALRPLADSLAHGAFAPPFDGYAWTITARPTLATNDLVDVDVRVEWSGGAYALTERLYRPVRRPSP